VVSVSFWVGYSDQRFKAVSTRRHPAAVYIRISCKKRLGRSDINMIEIENNKAAMIEKGFVTTRRKLPAEKNNGELLL
jgi:hypothetical protein